jgi:galactose mutarotase-like enzyme
MNASELKKYVGTMDQLARVRTSVLDDGRGRGIRIADVDNGSGLRFTILLDRGMDIGDASCGGKPFVYQSPVGVVHPSHFEAGGLGWLRSFGCGLLTSCGLSNIGEPDGEHGLHGRLSNSPAENVAVSKDWNDGEYVLSVSGIIREVSFMGENLELRRTISTAMGDNSITITDEVTNRGVRPSPMMILYHINAGFPLLNENSILDGRVAVTTPRSDEAAAGIGEWRQCQSPTAGYAEQCFYHDVEPDPDGMARMTLRNPDNATALEVAYSKAELPYFTQWKMMGEQEYVMGLEPSNSLLSGQTAEKENGRLCVLAPDETQTCRVKISFSA